MAAAKLVIDDRHGEGAVAFLHCPFCDRSDVLRLYEIKSAGDAELAVELPYCSDKGLCLFRVAAVGVCSFEVYENAKNRCRANILTSYR